jgi:hypothetical protein
MFINIKIYIYSMYSQVWDTHYPTGSTWINTYKNLITKYVPKNCDLRTWILEFFNWKIYELIALDDTDSRRNYAEAIIDNYFHSNEFPEWNEHPVVRHIRDLALDVIEALRKKEDEQSEQANKGKHALH